MCYKQEKHKKIENSLNDKLENVPDFISNFFNRYKSAATKKVNWGYIENLLMFFIEKGDIPKQSISEITKEDMEKLTSDHIIKYLNYLRGSNSLNSLNTKKNVFSSFWNYLLVNKYVPENIIKHIPRNLYRDEKDDDEVVEVPSDEQLERFLTNLTAKNCDNYYVCRNITIVKLILGSGIRSEELINMDLKDLFLELERPYIMILGKGKLEKYSKVRISEEAALYLKEYLPEREKFVQENGIESNALFLSNKKNRISKEVLTNLFERYSNNTIYPHMLRHYVGTELYKKTKDIVLVQKQLRHANLETAAKYYVHIDENIIADAIFNL